jgi:hypothetical protein
VVAPGVLFSDFAILRTPAFDFAIVFICRTSALVHSRRATFLALAISTPHFCETALYHEAPQWQWHNQAALPVVEFPQNLATFAQPFIEFERAMFERRLVHGGNPLLRRCVGNLVFMEDASSNRRPHEAKSIDRIDAAVSTIMAVGRAASNASVEQCADGLAFA